MRADITIWDRDTYYRYTTRSSVKYTTVLYLNSRGSKILAVPVKLLQKKERGSDQGFDVKNKKTVSQNKK